MRSFIEQQINAQYPYAQIEEMIDYNIFQPSSKIVGAYLKNKQPEVFAFRTYKKMDSDPMSSILNVLSKINEHNSSAAVQFTTICVDAVAKQANTSSSDARSVSATTCAPARAARSSSRTKAARSAPLSSQHATTTMSPSTAARRPRSRTWRFTTR